MAIKDKEKYNAYMKEYMQKRYYERMNLARERLGGKCVICSVQNDLEFDHINPDDKMFDISDGWNKPLDIFLSEVDKCELKCNGHHKAKHESPHGTYGQYQRRGCRCDLCLQWRKDETIRHRLWRMTRKGR